ncbi:hypothetical protein RZS08_38495, partial [Arthrospira platensis SPKY1]|nr:hypothetical protein [Arthrospira platensis SPKY1]
GERLLLAQEEHARVDEAHAAPAGLEHLERGLVGLQQQGDLLLDGDVERIDARRGAPRALGRRRHGGELDGAAQRRAVRARLRHRLLRDADDLVAREVVRGREAPRPVHEHAHPD